MSEKDGGPAFPCVNNASELIESTGMTLRDYFAAQFLTTVKIHGSGVSPDEVAKSCYVMADAMLRVRQA